jgi:hypothetical protein
MPARKQLAVHKVVTFMTEANTNVRFRFCRGPVGMGSVSAEQHAGHWFSMGATNDSWPNPARAPSSEVPSADGSECVERGDDFLGGHTHVKHETRPFRDQLCSRNILSMAMVHHLEA